jgi:uncharacterized membrane protein YeiH
VGVGCVTAVGGGTLRDALLLARTPFWVRAEPEYGAIALAAALAAFALWPGLPGGNSVKDETGGEGPLLWWLDAVSLGTFAAVGAISGLNAGVAAPFAALCGMLTATGGGMVRDVLTARPVRVLHSEQSVYATCAGLGAATVVAGVYKNIGGGSQHVKSAGRGGLAVAAGVAVAIGARYLGREMGLPTWQHMDYALHPVERDASPVARRRDDDQ